MPKYAMKSALCIVMLLLLSACATVSPLTVATVNDSSPSVSGFDQAYYSYIDHNTLDLILIRGSEDAPEDVLHVRMLWEPRAGKTPLDPFATNCVVRYITFRDDQMGVYGGGGLIRPDSGLGSGTLHITLHNSSLALQDATEKFGDEQLLMTATGRFTATRDDIRTQRLVRLISEKVSEKLGYPRFVQQSNPSRATSLAAR